MSTVGVAQEREGYYVSVELGLADPLEMDSEIFGTNHPTECDQLLVQNDGTTKDPAVIAIDSQTCTEVVPESIIQNAFDLDSWFMGGISAGYVRGQLRGEVEYVFRSNEGESTLIEAASAGAVLGIKSPNSTRTTSPRSIFPISAPRSFS